MDKSSSAHKVARGTLAFTHSADGHCRHRLRRQSRYCIAILRTLASSALLVLVALQSAPASGEGLSPCTDSFSQIHACRYEIIRRVLLPEEILRKRDASMRMVVLPSFEAEWVISIYLDDNSAEVELRESANKITSAMWTDSTCANPAKTADRFDSRVSRFALDHSLALMVIDLWREALSALSSSRDIWVSDGTNYHASAWVQGSGIFCGETWSPKSGIAWKMVQISDALRAIAKREEDTVPSIDELRRLLGTEPDPNH